jgi:hypothetical protein
VRRAHICSHQGTVLRHQPRAALSQGDIDRTRLIQTADRPGPYVVSTASSVLTIMEL